MKTDRELLELAAKAAGYRIEWVRNSGCHYRCEEEVGREQWCPLDDDGDALRLVVKLRMCVSIEFDAQAAYWAGDSLESFNQALDDDELTATRRAIVRAAAAIGEQME